MPYSLNQVQLIGNVTKAPEVRTTPAGAKVTTFGVATNFSYKDATGAKKDKAEFHNIVAWNKLAEICGQYIVKGTKVYIAGRMQTRSWEGQDGVKRYSTEVVATDLILLSPKSQGNSVAPEQPTPPTSAEELPDLEDLPF